MEKDNKYYEIIENLIRTHRKFNGYEPILDDIIDDVFKHAKSVINSVKDEDVVTSYLQKLVSVSIITVPRRMNFNGGQKIKPAVSAAEIIKKEQPQEAASEPQALVLEDPSPEYTEPAAEEQSVYLADDVPEITLSDDTEVKANVEFVDKMINSIDTASITEELPADNTLEISEDDNLDNLEVEVSDDEPVEALQIIEDDENDDSDFSEVVSEEQDDNVFTLSDENESEHDTFESFVQEDNEKEDFSMAEDNDEADTEEIEDLTVISEEDEAEPLSEAESTETVFDNSLELQTEEPVLTYSDSFESDELSVDETPAVSEPVELESNTEAKPVMSDAELTLDNTDTFAEPVLSIDNDEPSLNTDFNISTDFSDIDPDTISLEGDTSELTEFTETPDIQLSSQFEDTDFSLEGDDSSIELVAAPEPGEPQEKEEDRSFKPVDYSLFSYTPENTEDAANINEIERKLADLNKKNPELNILKIFELRYKQNLPIANIAEELQLEKQAVVTALDEIVELI